MASNYYIAMWASIICSTVLLANNNAIAGLIWFVAAFIYGVLCMRSTEK